MVLLPAFTWTKRIIYILILSVDKFVLQVFWVSHWSTPGLYRSIKRLLIFFNLQYRYFYKLFTHLLDFYAKLYLVVLLKLMVLITYTNILYYIGSSKYLYNAIFLLLQHTIFFIFRNKTYLYFYHQSFFFYNQKHVTSILKVRGGGSQTNFQYQHLTLPKKWTCSHEHLIFL